MMQENFCFVLMPFDNQFADYYQKIYKPAIEQCKLVARRADSIYRPSPILHDIWNFINDSALVLADITGKNPNVMYELGLSHAIAKPAIIISNNIDDVPFDLRSLRILLYNTHNPSWAEELKTSITKAITETIDSPTDAVLPTFLKVRPTKQEDVGDLKKDLIEIKQYLYRLDLENEPSEEKDRTSILNSNDYGQAFKDAYKLYFKDGLDMSEIKHYLVSKYNMSVHTAIDIVDRLRQ